MREALVLHGLLGVLLGAQLVGLLKAHARGEVVRILPEVSMAIRSDPPVVISFDPPVIVS